MVPTGPKSSWQAQAHAIIEQGYPAIAPLLPDLVAWLRDINWPGAGEIAAFLVTIGAPVLPHVQVVLQSTDRTWQYFVLHHLVDKWPLALVASLEPELHTLTYLTDGEEVDIIALKQLAKHQLTPVEFIRNMTTRKRRTYEMLLDDITEIEQYLKP